MLLSLFAPNPLGTVPFVQFVAPRPLGTVTCASMVSVSATPLGA